MAFIRPTSLVTAVKFLQENYWTQKLWNGPRNQQNAEGACGRNKFSLNMQMLFPHSGNQPVIQRRQLRNPPPPTFTLMKEWGGGSRHIDTIELYTAEEMNTLQLHVPTWVNLKYITLIKKIASHRRTRVV